MLALVCWRIQNILSRFFFRFFVEKFFDAANTLRVLRNDEFLIIEKLQHSSAAEDDVNVGKSLSFLTSEITKFQ